MTIHTTVTMQVVAKHGQTDALVRDLTLLVDRIATDATVDTGLVTLLPGERTTFGVAGIDSLDPADVLVPTVLRHGNQLVAA